ncbi:MAG: HDOD domain-containing protein [Gallionellaceae bacterium]
MQQESKDLKGWVAYLGNIEIPILKQTARELQVLRDDDNASAQSISNIIARDPLMTALLLRYLQKHKHRSQTNEVLEVEQALLMLGIDPFYTRVVSNVTVEEMLGGKIPALLATLHVVHRSHRASAYAYDWAVRRRDMHYEEIRVAALLRDMTEILMWCFAPADMFKVQALQDHDKSMRSGLAQEQVFGFRLVSLQKELVKEWQLPALLLNLINAENNQQPRVLNVVLADRLARHSAHGWNDAGLPDDYKMIGELLNVKVEDVLEIVGAEIPI